MSFAIIIKTLRDSRKSTFFWALGLLGMTAIQLYIYPSVVKSSGAMQSYIDAFPEAIKNIFPMEDYTSGAGFLGVELYSLMVPLIFVAVGAARGSSAIAGEEENGTADILFALPISRTKIILSKIFALIMEISFLSIATIIAIAIGSRMVDMTISMQAVVIATIASGLLGLIFGAISLLAGSLTGKKGAATGVAVALGIAALLFYTIAPLVNTFDSIAPFNPMTWAINGNPLSAGVPASHAVKLIATALGITAISIAVFRKRDIKA